KQFVGLEGALDRIEDRVGVLDVGAVLVRFVGHVDRHDDPDVVPGLQVRDARVPFRERGIAMFEVHLPRYVDVQIDDADRRTLVPRTGRRKRHAQEHRRGNERDERKASHDQCARKPIMNPRPRHTAPTSATTHTGTPFGAGAFTMSIEGEGPVIVGTPGGRCWLTCVGTACGAYMGFTAVAATFGGGGTLGTFEGDCGWGVICGCTGCGV